jgi:hypothetical protein
VFKDSASQLGAESFFYLRRTKGEVVQKENATNRENRIRQSIVRWTYQQMPLDTLCQVAAEIGFEGIDVLAPEDLATTKLSESTGTNTTISSKIHFVGMLRSRKNMR